MMKMSYSHFQSGDKSPGAGSGPEAQKAAHDFWPFDLYPCSMTVHHHGVPSMIK